MENNTENQARFNTQYWGQPIGTMLIDSREPVQHKIPVFGQNLSYITLKPLSQISDGDLKRIWEIGEFEDEFNAGLRLNHILLMKDCGCFERSPVVDYLRLQGYAILYMDLSVEQMIEYGWIKLKSE